MMMTLWVVICTLYKVSDISDRVLYLTFFGIGRETRGNHCCWGFQRIQPLLAFNDTAAFWCNVNFGFKHLHFKIIFFSFLITLCTSAGTLYLNNRWSIGGLLSFIRSVGFDRSQYIRSAGKAQISIILTKKKQSKNKI